MPGDYSRFTFKPSRRYSQVRMQQGRVQLDADWNEQAGILADTRERVLRDVIGPCGVPKGSDAFRIVVLRVAGRPVDLGILPGRYYVDGRVADSGGESTEAIRIGTAATAVQPRDARLDGRAFATGQWLLATGGGNALAARIEAVSAANGALRLSESLANFPESVTLRRISSYLGQPFDPAPAFRGADGNLALPAGTYHAYLDLWEREITSLDDPHLLEPALGGVDTTTRLQVAWRVGLVATTPNASCATPLPASVTTAPSGRLNARTRPPETQDDVCQLPPSTGYRRLENQLYRVEVHRGGDRANATFKWSRDNGIVATRIELIDARVLTVTDLGRDEVLGFAPGQWVEIVGSASSPEANPPNLFQIDAVDSARRQITLTESAAARAGETGLQLRRWDQDAAATGATMSADWLALESGIEVQFSAGSYRSGDFWLIPARTATGEIEWPPFSVPNTAPEAQAPHGVRHGHCALALVDANPNGVTLRQDCRREFPPLTGICAEDVCFDPSACEFEGATTVQEALDRLCSQPAGGSPVVTGVVLFDFANTEQMEMISGPINPGLGAGALQVVTGLQGPRTVFIGAVDNFETLDYPIALTAADVLPLNGTFRIAIRLQTRGNATTGAAANFDPRVRVRWWASRPTRQLDEIVVTPTAAPTIGPTVFPTILPTIVPTVLPTVLPTILPTISPTLTPTVRPTVLPTVLPTISPTLVPTLRPTLAPTILPTVRPTGLPTLAPIPIVRGLDDIRGLDATGSARLTRAGITDANALANANVAAVVAAMGVSEVRARALIEAAREIVRSGGG